METLIKWEFAAKLWMWHTFGWWLIAWPFLAYGGMLLYGALHDPLKKFRETKGAEK